MQKLTIFAAVLACTAAAPGLYLHETHHHILPLTSKSTLTKSSHAINHGSTYVHTPVISTPVVSVVSAPILKHLSSKTTVTKSSQVVNHGGTEVHRVPVVHAVHAAPVVHATPVHYIHSEPAKSSQYYHLDNTVYHSQKLIPVVHTSPVLVHSSPLVTVKTGDSAVSHHSSTVHETVPVVKSLPLYAYHH